MRCERCRRTRSWICERPRFSGVYSVHDGKLRLVSTDFTGPNGLAFSPDENFLYVGDWDEKHKVVKRYPVNADDTLVRDALFFDVTARLARMRLTASRWTKLADRPTLYLAAQTGIYRIRLNSPGAGSLTESAWAIKTKPPVCKV